jgi:DNA-binding XRE family transcriptional regulator
MMKQKVGLRVLRDRAGLSQEKLAAAARCSSGTIRLVEAGAGCSDEMAARIAGVLKCEPARLFEKVGDDDC